MGGDLMTIDGYLDDLACRLHLPARARDRIIEEVRDHLMESVEVRIAEGADLDDASRAALAAFGGAAEVAARFGAAWQTRALRAIPATSAVTGVVAVGGFLLASLTQPALSHPQASAPLVVQVPFQVGAVALQIAFVAGVLALIRTASRWRLVEASSADRRLVMRTGGVGAVGIGVVAAAWAVALVADGLVHRDARWSTLVGGIALMLVAATAGVVLPSRLGRLDADEASEPGAPVGRGVLALGERALAVQQRLPAAVCASVALVTGAAAAVFAEEPLPASLAWGAGEAIVVVAAFLLLGQTLGLRGTPATLK